LTENPNEKGTSVHNITLNTLRQEQLTHLFNY